MRILFAGLLSIGVAATACQGPAPSAPGADASQPIAATLVATPEPEVTAEPTVDPAAQAIITAVALAAAPTATPLARTTSTPMATPVPPSKAVESSATDLQTKLGALTAALRTQDTATALRLQRELLASADQAESALKNDRSQSAQSVRLAIVDIRSSAAGGGESNGYAHAAASLHQVLGGGTGLGVTATGQTQQPDASTDMHTLADEVRGLRDAVQNHNSGEALRLQGQLIGAVGTLQKQVEKDDSDQGKAMKSMLADLQKGLDGDPMRLTAASAALDKLSGSTTTDHQVAGDASQVAASLAAKVDAFRVAASTNSKGDLLRMQQEILTEVDQDVAALPPTQSDQAPQISMLRAALNDVRSGVSGDLTKLDGARAQLGKLSGEQGTSAAGATPGNVSSASAAPIGDLKKFAGDLDGTVNAFQAALQKNDTGTMLQLQRRLNEQAAQADTSLRDAQSKPADEVRAAVASIRTAFAGDLTKLDEAHVHLRTVTTGAAPGQGTPTTGADAAAGGKDVQRVANDLHDTLTRLATASRDHQGADEIAHRRDALKAQIASTEAALNSATNDPRADRLRNALAQAREAAAGDDTKASAAASALDAALSGN